LEENDAGTGGSLAALISSKSRAHFAVVVNVAFRLCKKGSGREGSSDRHHPQHL